MADSKLPQKPLRENLFKRIVTRLVLLAFLNQNLAFATNIELDFKDSQTPQRLHVIPRMSNVGDVSHVEIDTGKQKIAVYRHEKQTDKVDDHQEGLGRSESIPMASNSVILQNHNVQNLPWDLEPEQLTLFILNHTAWLKPLDENGYKLEFKGGLLGGGQGQSTGGGGSGGSSDRGGQQNIHHCSRAEKTDKVCWSHGGNFYASNSSWIGGNPGNVSIISNPNYIYGGSSSGKTNDTGRSYGKSSNETSGGYNPNHESFKESTSSSGLPCIIYKPSHISRSDEKALRQECGQTALSIATEKSLFKHIPHLKDSYVDKLLSPLTEIVLWECDHGKGKSQIEIAHSIRQKFKVVAKNSGIYEHDYQKNLAMPRVMQAVPAQLAVLAHKTIQKMTEAHNIQVKALSQKFMKQGRGFTEIKKPFQQNKNEGSIYKGSRYNVEFPLSPLELEACQGKTLCLLSHLKTDTPDVCRVQVVAFKGNVVVGNACSDALPSGKWGYLFTALHFDFKDYDSVWVRPLRTGGTQDSIISAWSYSTWITDIPISQKETSHTKLVLNSQNTISFAFPDSPLVYPYFSKDRTTAASFLPAKSYSLDTGNRLFQEFLMNMAGDEGSSSFQNALAVTPYIKNHVLQHTPFKDKGFPDLKTSSQSLLMMTVEALYGDSPQKFLDQSKIFYTKAIPFQELSKAYQTHHEILGSMLPASWQEMIKKQGKTALTPHSNLLAQWSIIHDVATEMGRQCGIPVPSVFSTLDVIQSITKAGFEFFALDPENRKIFCQQFDGFGQSLCEWLDYNFDPLFDGVLFLTTKGQGKVVPIKGLQLKPKAQANLYKNVPPVLERVPDFKWTVKESNVAPRIGQHQKFGKIYQDPTQKVGNKEVWWSKDTAKHGGSEYKLYEETGKTFEWIGDVSSTGKVILKHKSEIGRSIMKKEINWIK